MLPTALHQIVGSLVTVFMTSQGELIARPVGVTEPIEAIAASEDGVVVVTRAGISVLDPTGVRIRTLWAVGPRAEHHHLMKMDGSGAAPGLPADLDWARRSDTGEIDDPDDPRLADEGPPGADESDDVMARPHGTFPMVAATDVVVAAAGPHAWVGLQDGLWQVDLATGISRRAVRGDAGHLAIHRVTSSADGRIVVFVERNNLYRSSDRGRTFEATAAVDSPPRAMAATNNGAIVFIDGASGTVQVVPPDRHDEVTMLSVEGATDLASCGTATLVLRSDALFAVRWSSDTAIVERRGAVPQGTSRIACGADGRLWVSGSEELCSSADEGRSWSTRGDTPPGSTRGIAVSGRTLWIASTSGLWMAVSTGAENRERASVSLFVSPQGFETPWMDRVSPKTFRWWSTILPRVDLLAAAARRGGRHDVRGLVLLTFSFEPKHTNDSRVAASHAQREPVTRAPRVTAAGDIADLNRDPVDVEEHDALVHVMEDSP